MEYRYTRTSRAMAIEGVERLIVDNIWRMANTELKRAILFGETQELFDGTVPDGLDVHTVLVVHNLKNAWKFLLKNLDRPLSFELVSEYNRRMGESGVFPSPGQLREDCVRISGTTYQPAIPVLLEVQEAIEKVTSIENPVERALTAFDKIARDCWFSGGNILTAQMVASHILIQENVGMLTIPTSRKKQFYEELTNYYQSSDPQELNDYLYKTSVEELPSGITFPELEVLEAKKAEETYK